MSKFKPGDKVVMIDCLICEGGILKHYDGGMYAEYIKARKEFTIESYYNSPHYTGASYNIKEMEEILYEEEIELATITNWKDTMGVFK